MGINWLRLEERLYRLTVKDIRRFASIHKNETFYGFAFDCNSEYGQVLLCLNTPEYLQERAALYVTNPPNKEAWDAIHQKVEEAIGKKIYSRSQPTTLEEEKKKLRWSLGDWKYQGFNSWIFTLRWWAFEKTIFKSWHLEEENEATYMTPTQNRFMETVCRVLIRLESSGAFNPLNRTNDFTAFASDHDEWDNESWDRLATVRQAMAHS